MTFKDLLNKKSEIEAEIKSLREQIEISKAKREQITITLKEKVQTSSKNSTEDLIIKVLDLEDKQYKKLIELAKTKNLILDVFNLIDNNLYSSLIRNKYILHKKYSELLKEYRFSEQRLYSLMREALKEADEKYQKLIVNDSTTSVIM